MRTDHTPCVSATRVFTAACVAALMALAPAASHVAVQAQASAPAIDAARLQALRFRNIGPHRGGRVTAVAGHRAQLGTFYMGATGGGVWKTTDYGVTWQNVSDGYFPTGSIGAIAVAESNPDIVYVGTGSAAIRSNVIQGRGMFRSADAGKTWKAIGLREVGQIGAVLVDPTDANVVYVAALGQPFGPNAERGVFKSVDGGTTWTHALRINDKTGVVSLSMNPSNPREIYAGSWQAVRKPWTIVSGGPAAETGLYKTSDAGTTWEHLTNGLPTNLIGKMSVDVSPANPNRVYVLLEAPGTERGVYRSDDAGRSFTQMNSEMSLIRRPFYYTYIDAHPKDADTVYVNNEGFFISTDGGKTWNTRPTPHGDNHGMWINPDQPDIFIQSNDGGANVTTNGGRTWSSQLNQSTAELYQVDVDDQFPYRVYGAQQDTGSPLILPSLPPTAANYMSPLQLWQPGPGCETGPVKPTPGAAHILWGVCKGEISRMNMQTGQEAHFWVYPQNRYGHAARDIRYRFQRVSPFAFSPHDPKVIYHISQYVHRTTDSGMTWETISPDLTANEPDKQGTSGEPITRDITGEEVYSTLYSVMEAKTERGVIWTGANDGPVHVTRDNGKTWTNVTPRDLPPGGRVQNVEVSPHRKGSAYIAVYRYLLNDYQPYIYRTDDYGKTWTRLTTGTNGIPADYPTRVVREDPDRVGLLYAGTEFGMFISFDNGGSWQAFQQNLPVTPITDIIVTRQDMVISTMGRGFWIMDNVSALHQLSADAMTSAATLLTPRPAYRMRYAAMGNAAGEPEYPAPSAHIDYVLAKPVDGVMTLEIIDPRTKELVRRITNEGPAPQNETTQGMRAPVTQRAGGPRLSNNAGLNRFAWDMRLAGDAGARGGGPLVVPGTYDVRLSIPGMGAELRSTLEIRIDPRVAADGISVSDLQVQFDVLKRIRTSAAAARALVSKLGEARKAAGISPERVKAITAIEAKLVTAGGAYPQPMLIDQYGNVARMLGQADQKVGKDAYLRLDDLDKALAAITTDVDAVVK